MYNSHRSLPTAPSVAAALTGSGAGPKVVRTSRRSPSGWSMRVTFEPHMFGVACGFAQRWRGALRRSVTGCWILTVAVAGLRGVPLAAIERMCQLSGAGVAL